MSKTKTLTRSGQRSRTSRNLSSCSSFSTNRKRGAAVVQDVLDLLGGIGRIDAVGDAAGRHGAHVGIEPFRHGLGQDRHDLAVAAARDLTRPMPAALARSPYSRHDVARQMPRSFSRKAVRVAARLHLMPEQLRDRVAAFDLDPGCGFMAAHRASSSQSISPVLLIATSCASSSAARRARLFLDAEIELLDVFLLAAAARRCRPSRCGRLSST